MPVRRPTFALAALLSGLLGCALAELRPPSLPAAQPVERLIALEQGWTEEEAHWYHHASQGTATLQVPYEWLVALEQPRISLREAPPLVDPTYLSRFGFIASPRSESNPGGLPVGFTVDPDFTDPETGERMNAVGFTCAACHTAQLEYRGTAMRIEGGPAMTDLGKFRKALGLAVAYTKFLPFRFGRFADRVLGADHEKAAADALEAEIDAFIASARANPELGDDVVSNSIEEGFTRLDAIGRIGNFVFGVELDAANVVPLRAPVNYPHVWSTSWFDWVQYNGSIRQPMVRNAGEAMGVRARVALRGPETDRYRSTVRVETLYAIESQLAGPAPFEGLRAPKWPEDVLPPIDRARAARGAALYAELCQDCHLPPLDSDEIRADRYWSAPNEAGERYLKLRMIDVDYMGTDPAQADGMRERTVETGPLGLGVLGFGPALGAVVERTVERWYDEQEPAVPPAVRARMNGNRKNLLRAEDKYRARPLDGIWATPPYLHNGSVPDLYALLLPAEERPSRFHLGRRELDPVRVGLVVEELDGGFELRTDEPGNSNRGHELRDGPRGNGVIGRGLSDAERWDLVEYLKTL